jgi:hypothetical protein
LRRRAALVLAMLALGAAGCGGDDEPAADSAEPVDAPELSVPGGDAPALGGDATGTGTGTAPEPANPGETATQAPGEGDGSAPEDGPGSDTPAETDSPPGRFEDFCEANPGACE